MNITASNRLSYKLMTKEDSNLLFQLDQNPQVMRFINGGKPSSMKTITEVFIPRMESYRDEQKGWGLWQVNISATNEFIGWILVRPMNFFSDTPEFKNLELGWRFLQSSWGKGYATEAALHIKHALSKNSEIECFSAIADEDNVGSISVMKKIGMSYIKTYLHKDPLFECHVAYYQVKNELS
ncbi:GNAT family N-acetyltransferase [Paraglaciecola sp. 2405UD69-4]|uniref:GNAT family N-acetyltransferase n=1 Tax=Paraglaciecola sp. 2405UD69-4 TaxID=3391836 RepID=UPI0039C96797